MEYKEKVNLDFRKANSYLSENTINFGNRTVVTSAFLILISLNFLKLEGVEIEGITFSINSLIITLVLVIVNFYYYQQFILSYDVDDKSNFIPDDYLQFRNDLQVIIELSEDKLNELLLTQKSISNEITLPETPLIRKKELLSDLQNLTNEMEKYKNIVDNSVIEVRKDELKLDQFSSVVSKYKILNIKIPKIIYFIGLSAVIFKFCIYVYSVFQTQEYPWHYILENELQYYKMIFN